MKKKFTIILVVISINTYAEKDILKLYAKLNNVKHLKDKFYAYIEIGDYYYLKGRPDSMLIFAQYALTTAHELKNDSLLAASYRVLGNSSYLKSDCVTAIEYYFRGLNKVINKPDLKRFVPIFYNNIGHNYHRLGFSDKSLEYLKKGEQFVLLHPEVGANTYIYENLAETYLSLDMPDTALFYLQLATNTNLKSNDKYIQSGIYLYYAKTYIRLNERELAEVYFKKAIDLSSSMQDNRHLASAAYEYGSFLFRKNKLDSAKQYSIYSLNISKENNYRDDVVNNADLLSTIYHDNKLIDSAYYFSRLKDEYRDIISNLQKQNQLIAMTFNEEIKEKEDEVKKQEEEHQRKKNIQNFTIAISLFLFIGFFVLLSQSILINTKSIVFLGMMVLLVTFEFINLLLHPMIAHVTKESPFFMLLILVIIAAILIPIHKFIEKFIEKTLVRKNQRIRVAKAKKILEEAQAASAHHGPPNKKY